MDVFIYCDRTDCLSNADQECQRTSIKIEADASHSGAYCKSVEIRKAPTDVTTEQEPK